MVSVRNTLISLIFPVFLIILWEYSVTSGLWPESIIARPIDALKSIFQISYSGELLQHIQASMTPLILGFFSGASLALMLGVWIGVSQRLEQLLLPTIVMLRPIPPIAWIPLLIVFFGIGIGSKIALIAIGVFFVLFTSAVSGIRNVSADIIELATLYQKSKKELIVNILIPASLAEMLTSLRIALALSWVLLLAAEIIASSHGLGWLIWDSRNFSRPDDMIAGMIIVGILGSITDSFVVWSQKRLLVWKNTFIGI